MPLPALAGAVARFAAGMVRGAASATVRGVRAAGRAASRSRGRPTGGAPSKPFPFGMRGSDARGNPPTPSTPPKEPIFDKLWKYDSAWSLAERLSGFFEKNTPAFMHVIDVMVVGGPAADLRRVWYLACAAAFGRYRNRANGYGDSNIDAVWDITGKSAKISIGYVLSGALGNLTPGGTKSVLGGALVAGGTVLGPLGIPMIIGGTALAIDGAIQQSDDALKFQGSAGGLSLMQEGPDQVTIGASWPNWFRRQPGPGSLPPDVKRDRGVYNKFDPVVVSCADPDSLNRFWPRQKIDVLGELVRTVNGQRIIPFGQVIALGQYAAVTGGYGAVGQPYGIRAKVGRFTTSPLLPDDGRIITTGEKRDPMVQPPRPWLDGQSRMSVVELIAAALHQPCFAPQSVGCPIMPVGGNRAPIYQPGASEPTGGLSLLASGIIPITFTAPTSNSPPITTPIPRLGE